MINLTQSNFEDVLFLLPLFWYFSFFPLFFYFRIFLIAIFDKFCVTFSSNSFHFLFLIWFSFFFCCCCVTLTLFQVVLFSLLLFLNFSFLQTDVYLSFWWLLLFFPSFLSIFFVVVWFIELNFSN